MEWEILNSANVLDATQFVIERFFGAANAGNDADRNDGPYLVVIVDDEPNGLLDDAADVDVVLVVDAVLVDGVVSDAVVTDG